MTAPTDLSDVLATDPFSRDDIVRLLRAEGDERLRLFRHAAAIKEQHVGKVTWLRGLIESSNVCEKDCLYCGIRAGNRNVTRYRMQDDEILEAVRFASEQGYGSVVLQSGEIRHAAFTARVSRLLDAIAGIGDGAMRVTLSFGEQDEKTFREWYEHGARRYLLRIETSNRALYARLHPNDALHDYDARLRCLALLRETGYQVGTGVMIGFPFQTDEDLADDLLFMQRIDVDMVGMGPYIEHPDTPLYAHREALAPVAHRIDRTLKMVAILRSMMKNINIAAVTALQALDPVGREKALAAGANVIMPNITPERYRNAYTLYTGKPCTDEKPEECATCMDLRIAMAGDTVGYGAHGDSVHWTARMAKEGR
ncbi:MAG: [FeFe] hydrogenase H-cluster radical SAM maturase HydE [Ignavibacteria bacterium]|nr:[FeFe] hydrogenase H-cluster radical SAM maturase HydE [Ignavibacteria bacterium]